MIDQIKLYKKYKLIRNMRDTFYATNIFEENMSHLWQKIFPTCISTFCLKKENFY